MLFKPGIAISKAGAAFLFCASVFGAPCQAETLTFDDLQSGAAIPNDYGGLVWGSLPGSPQFLAVNAFGPLPSGLPNLVVSPPNVAMNAISSQELIISAPPNQTFTLNSLYLGSPFVDGEQVAICCAPAPANPDVGPPPPATFTLTTEKPVLATLNWSNLNSVTLQLSREQAKSVRMGTTVLFCR